MAKKLKMTMEDGSIQEAPLLNDSNKIDSELLPDSGGSSAIDVEDLSSELGECDGLTSKKLYRVGNVYYFYGYSNLNLEAGLYNYPDFIPSQYLLANVCGVLVGTNGETYGTCLLTNDIFNMSITARSYFRLSMTWIGGK
ncbi:MAG: hypothetical protein R3Y05_01355 [bacterium]